MNIIKTSIEGLLILEPRIFEDGRGYFFESYSQKDFDAAVGPVRFVQDNESFSSYGVVRGLHFQRPPYTQAKLVRCVSGRVLDVAVDIRRDSPTFMQHVSVELSGNNKRMFFIPKGFAHGFSVLGDHAVFQYKCDEFYHPEADDGFLLTDPSLNIDWGVPHDAMILSAKDLGRRRITPEDAI
ncbi:MAG: dTDP-4-dehydrorhamnose 3,5-epimerase [Bacteroidales bacterium]|nr:dTDP-4-dehydrorhamnose 3,5-epimerase [Bacteroidales bacterium]